MYKRNDEAMSPGAAYFLFQYEEVLDIISITFSSWMVATVEE